MRTLISSLLYVCAVATSAQHSPSVGNADGTTALATSATAQVHAPPLVLHINAHTGRLSVAWGDRSLTRMPVEVRNMEGGLVRLDCISPQQDLDLSELPHGSYVLYLMDLRGVRMQQRFTLPLDLARL
ncbi:MAG TPA: hypothetical protein PK760_10760 [Flavobacteriales bacterium]|nr:hypothetical protein [Flavobacteriales bacterium]